MFTFLYKCVIVELNPKNICSMLNKISLQAIQKKFAKKILQRKIKTYNAHIKAEQKKGAGPHNTKLLSLKSHLRDCKNKLEKLK